MECWLAEKEIEKGGVICLDDKEEDLFCWDSKERGANDCIGRIGPNSGVDQVGVPWRGRDDSNLDRSAMAADMRRHRGVLL